MPMKKQYLQPEAEVVFLSTSATILEASNEGYGVDPVDGGFSTMMPDNIFSDINLL